MIKVKKILSILMIISIFISFVLPINIANATYTIKQLRNMYPSNMQWNDKYKDGSSECAGFAYLIYDSYYGIGPKEYGNKITDVEQAQPGDIVRYNGHSVFILTRNGESTTVVECNYDRQNHVRWDQPKNMSEYRNSFEYIYKAPYILETPAPVVGVPTNVTVDTSKWVQASWSKPSNCYGYLLQVYNQEGTKVKEIKINKADTTEQAIAGLETGNYTLRVYAKGLAGDYSSEYGSAKFSCKKEATTCTLKTKSNVIEVGQTYEYEVVFPEGTTAYTTLFIDSEGDKSVLEIENQMTVRGLKEGNTKVFFMMRSSNTTRTESFQISVMNPLRFKDNEAKTLKIGDKYQLELKSKSEIANSVKWNSSNTSVATVDEHGNITALKAGKTTITASQSMWTTDHNASGTTQDKCTITVIDPNIYATSISLNKTEMTLENIGDTDILKATILPENTTNKTVTWTSSNTNVATVDENGKVKVKGEGKTKITAKTSNGKSTYCMVTVPKQIKCSLNYTDYTFSNLNETIQIQAKLTDGYSSTFSYKSTRDSILKVDKNGKVTPIKGGFADIVVTDNVYGKKATLSCYVQVPVVLSDGSKAYVGDLNKDGYFNATDAAIILDGYKNGATSDDVLLGDINGDGFLNASDSAMLLDIYKMGLFSPGKYDKMTEKVVKGDINGNEIVELTDYSMILKHVKGIKLLEGEQKEKADVNGNGTIELTDYSMVLKQVKGIKLLN